MATTQINMITIHHPGADEGITPGAPVIIGFKENLHREITLYLTEENGKASIKVTHIDFDTGGHMTYALSDDALQLIHEATAMREHVGIIQWRYAETLICWADRHLINRYLRGSGATDQSEELTHQATA